MLYQYSFGDNHSTEASMAATFPLMGDQSMRQQQMQQSAQLTHQYPYDADHPYLTGHAVQPPKPPADTFMATEDFYSSWNQMQQATPQMEPQYQEQYFHQYHQLPEQQHHQLPEQQHLDVQSKKNQSFKLRNNC